MLTIPAGGWAVRRAASLLSGVVALAAVAWGGAARADISYELTPTVGAGATNNAAVTPAGETNRAASFSYAGGTARLRYRGALVEHALGYHLTYTRFLIEDSPDAVSNNLAWLSSAALSARWALRFNASGTLTRSSGVDPSNPAAVVPQAGMAGSFLYFAGTAAQGASYRPDPRTNYDQTLTVGHLRYLESTVAGMEIARPTTTLLTLALSGNRLVGRETLMLDLMVSDMVTQFDSSVAVDPSRTGHTLFARLLAGWRHELSTFWSTTLQAGPSVIVRLDGNGVLAPAAVATLGYANMPWYAALTLAQTPMAHPYVGEATITDQALARLAVPVARSERIFVGGYGGYIYARVANGEAQLDRLFDAFVAGASLTYRFKSVPLAAAASYMVLSQRGSSLPGRGEIADYARQYMLISLRADLAWGPGTPPLFGGAL